MAIFLPPLLVDRVSGSLPNDYDDGNENVKKQLRLLAGQVTSSD